MTYANFVFKIIQRVLKEKGLINTKTMKRFRNLKRFITDSKRNPEYHWYLELRNVSVKLPNTTNFIRELDEKFDGLFYRKLYVLFYKFLKENNVYDIFTENLYKFKHISLKQYILIERQNPFYFISNAFAWMNNIDDWSELDDVWISHLAESLNNEMPTHNV